MIFTSRNEARPYSGSSITFENISKKYGSLSAIEEFSLKIEAGEFVSLLGPSGSGKTTLLMVLAGFEVPSSGKVRIGERDVTFVPPNKRDIGMVFQRYALFPHLTVAQNIAFPLRMRKMPKAEIKRNIERVLQLIQLEGFETRLPSQLSGGQQQRVAVGRALVFNPSVLLMDEPLGALDKKLREQMQIEIKHLQQSLGVTVIYVTHDQDEALTMSDRVAVINKGRLVQIGSPTALYLHPTDTFVADFVGKMNFLDGHVTEIGVDKCVVETVGGAKIVASRAALSDLPRVGQEMKVALRPEQLNLIRVNETADYCFRGTIQNSILVGSLQVFLIRTPGAAIIYIHALAGRGTVAFKNGDDVLIAYNPDDVRLFR